MGWLVAFGVLAALAVLPLGVRGEYHAGGAFAYLLIGPVKIRLYPKKEKPKQEDKQEQTEAEPAAAAQEKKKSAGGSWKDFLPLVKTLLSFLEDLSRKIRVNRLDMNLILADDDPAELGMNYGKACIALGNLWPRLEELFVIKKRNVQVQCDFMAEQTKVTARADITITLGRLLVLLVRYGWRAWKQYKIIRNQNKGGATI